MTVGLQKKLAPEAVRSKNKNVTMFNFAPFLLHTVPVVSRIRDLRSGIQDEELFGSRSGIQVKHPRSATLPFSSVHPVFEDDYPNRT
jgi:hypothetical protein